MLQHGKTPQVPATVGWARQSIECQERLRPGPVREVLRWFFRTVSAACPAVGKRAGAGAVCGMVEGRAGFAGSLPGVREDGGGREDGIARKRSASAGRA